MTDEPDEETAGVPVHSERADSGAHVTESGRHLTNRNVVPRSAVRDSDSGAREVVVPAVADDVFDVVTPVMAQPVGVALRDAFEVVTPAQPLPQAVEAFEVVTPAQSLPHAVAAFEVTTPALPLPPAPREAGADALGQTDPGEPTADAAPIAPARDAAVSDRERAAIVARRTPTGFLPGFAMPRAPLPPIDAAPPSGERTPRAASHGRPAADDAPSVPAPLSGERTPRAASHGRPAADDAPPGAEPVSGARTPPAGRAASPLPVRAASPLPVRAEAGRAATEPGRAPRAASEWTASPVALDRALRVVAIVAVFGLGAAGLAQPTSVLRGGIAWLAFLCFALVGWGTIVVRVARVGEPDAGQRAALGAAGYLAIAGPLLALGILTRPAILFLICIGFAGFAWREATAKIALWHRIRDGLLAVRANPGLGAFVIVLVVLAAVRMLGAVAALDRNPWDDDLAYTPLLKRLLDTGDLIEPFSVHRLAAYGGQTVLQALGAARGTIANVHLVDQALGFGIVLLLIAGFARERRTQPLWHGLIALVVLLLPEAALSTASAWLGVVGFVALYRSLVRAQWGLVGLLAAATCTLRHSFIAPVVVLVAIVLGARLIAAIHTMPRREAWHDERPAWALTGGVALAVIVPWWIAAYRASHTFLYPVLDGTWNPALAPAATTAAQDLAALVAGCLDTPPIVIIPVLALVVAFVADRRPGRPLPALVIASVVGLVVVVHAVLGAEPPELWRHAFGFSTALAIVLVLELGAEDDARVALVPLGRWIVLAALVLQIVAGRGALPAQTAALFDDLREASAIDRRGDPSARAEQRRVATMQAALPAGARAIVMLDDPALLDYRRNAIANLEVPGHASPGPGLPMFAGAEPLRAYLVAAGYRYAAFARSERSRSFFRRAFWVRRMFGDERFQVMAAYAVDAIDSFAELATTTPRLYDADGLVVLDLAHPTRAATTRTAAGDEPTRRAAWVRELADREGLHDAWSLTTRDDLRFEDGAGPPRHGSAAADAWREVAGASGEPAPRGPARRPVQRRVHLRVRGQAAMRLSLRAAIALPSVLTHPRLDVSLDGELLASAVADAAGRYAVDVTVPHARLAAGWHDLYLVFSTGAEPAAAPRDPHIAWLESVEWSPP